MFHWNITDGKSITNEKNIEIWSILGGNAQISNIDEFFVGNISFTFQNKLKILPTENPSIL